MHRARRYILRWLGVDPSSRLKLLTNVQWTAFKSLLKTGKMNSKHLAHSALPRGRTEPDVVIDICYSRTDNNRPSVPCTTVLASPISDASGRWDATVTIPESVVGTHP